MRSDFIAKEVLEQLLTALMPENRNALLVALYTGLRIDDVLSLPRFGVVYGALNHTVEKKTGKIKSWFCDDRLSEVFFQQANRAGILSKWYYFPHRLDYKRHRTRQAVWKDLKRVARLYRLNGEALKANITPHSTRKIYAVEGYKLTHDLGAVQCALNHSDPTITALYAFSDELTRQKLGRTQELS